MVETEGVLLVPLVAVEDKVEMVAQVDEVSGGDVMIAAEVDDEGDDGTDGAFVVAVVEMVNIEDDGVEVVVSTVDDVVEAVSAGTEVAVMEEFASCDARTHGEIVETVAEANVVVVVVNPSTVPTLNHT